MNAADLAPVISTFTYLSVSESARTKICTRSELVDEVEEGLKRFSGVDTVGDVEGLRRGTVRVGG